MRHMRTRAASIAIVAGLGILGVGCSDETDPTVDPTDGQTTAPADDQTTAPADDMTDEGTEQMTDEPTSTETATS